MLPSPGEITALLQLWRKGDREAENRLFELVLPELRRLARYFMKGERRGHSLQPSSVLNEAYIRLTGAREIDWRDRRHFFAVAARVMRRYLIDYARSRPSVIRLPLDTALTACLGTTANTLDIAIAVDGLLEELEKVHPGLPAIVELRYFLGLTEEETAETLQLSLRTTQRRWEQARGWLFERLKDDPGSSPIPA